jgi:ADP-ribose pyrophosphatase YjhB (NUDIX family)
MISGSRGEPGVLVAAVSAIVTDVAGRYLLVRRSRPPEAGRWALPGGRVEPGETLAEAVIREVVEETGLAVRPSREVGVVRRPGPGGVTYEIHCFIVDLLGGEAVAGSDAADVRWVAPHDLSAMETTRGLLEALRTWGA